MSSIKIEIRAGRNGLRTEVFVDGKFAYQSGTAIAIEQEHIDRLIELIPIENTETISVYSKKEKR